MDRRTQREWVVKILYQLQFGTLDKTNLEKSLELHELVDEEFITSSLNSIIENQDLIDSYIKPKLKRTKFEHLSKIDKAILRTSVNEFLVQKSVPNNVSISEAVEISKLYGDSDSYKYINGILSAIDKEN